MAESLSARQASKKTMAIILAGGRGSRLHQMTDTRAKPAVYFGGKFRIIDFALSNCINSGIRKIGVVTQYKSHSLLRHLQAGWSFLRNQFNEFLDLLPAQQRIDEVHWYRGTADAVYQNIDIIKDHRPQYILILAGDHVYKMDYAKLLLDLFSERSSGRPHPTHSWVTVDSLARYYSKSMTFVVMYWIRTGMEASPEEVASVYEYIVTRSLWDVLEEL